MSVVVRRFEGSFVGSMRGFFRITVLLGLLVASIEAMAYERELPGDRAVSAFRNSEDCAFYAIALEKTRETQSLLRAEKARLAGVVTGAEVSLKSCAENAGLDYNGVDENDLANACNQPYESWITSGVRLRLIDEELAKMADTSEEVALATELRCTPPKNR